MRPATDSASNVKRCSLRPCVLVVVFLAQPGCSRLHELRYAGPEPFGTSTPGITGGTPVASADPYADRMRMATAARLAARSNSSPAAPVQDGSQPAARQTQVALNRGPSRTPTEPGVTLAPPEPLTTVADPSRTVASRGPREAWSGTDANELPKLAAPVGTAAAGINKPAEPASPLSVEQLVAETRSKLDKLVSYQVSINRQERVGNTLLPAEDIVLSIRRNPRAVRLEWPSGSNKGREVLYSPNETGGRMQINSADSLVPRLSLPPDSPLVLKNSRHPITEAGFDPIVKNIEEPLALAKQGKPAGGKITYLGLGQPAPLDHPCHQIMRVTPTGEKWLVCLDPKSKLPVLVQANDASGTLLERYVFGPARENLPDLARAEAFDPNRRWGEPKGLFSRLARLPAGGAQPTADTTTR
jgi:hypothetical protein